MEKEKTLKIIIASVAVCALVAALALFYIKINNEYDELKTSINGINRDLFNLQQENAKIMNKLNNEEENDTVVYEDELYKVFKEVDIQQYTQYTLLVFDKKSNAPINTNGAVTYFGKVDGNYYYVELSFGENEVPISKVYKIDGTLLKTFEGVFESYNSKTKEFTFYVYPETVDADTVTWSPVK